jgi:hypothetical protein
MKYKNTTGKKDCNQETGDHGKQARGQKNSKRKKKEIKREDRYVDDWRACNQAAGR